MPLLFEFPPTRSNWAKWTLKELGVTYDCQTVELLKGEQNNDAYRAIQPLGPVPALKTDGYTIFEYVAILLQSIDEHPDQNLGPPPSGPERGLYYQWASFAAGEVNPAIILVFDNTTRLLNGMRPARSQHDPAMAEKGRYEFGRRAAILTDALNGRDYLEGATLPAPKSSSPITFSWQQPSV
jgi:glutathione S-transferase